MGTVRTLSFHTKYGPAPLFDKAREQLNDLSALNLEIPHAQSRFAERGIPLQYLTDFQPEHWTLVTIETAVRTGRITYMSLRRRLESQEYLWIVLAFEHVLTAWVTESPRNRPTRRSIVKRGPAWEAAAEGREPIWTAAMSEWEHAQARRVRAQRILTALAALPEYPSGERLAHAANVALAGGNWNDAAVDAGWASRRSMDAKITRLFRAASRGSPGVDG